MKFRFHHAALALLGSAWALAVQAQAYPARSITLLTPIAPGAAVDRITRAWMACAETRSGQTFVLMHRPGGNGVVAASALLKAAADGYTLMVAGMSQTTIVPLMSKKPPYDPEKDFQGAAIFATSPYVLVASAQSGIKSIAELQAAAKDRPAGIDLGIPNIATPAHLLGASLAARLNIEATMVPVNGEAGGLAALLGGHIPAMIFVPGTVAPHIASGRVVPLMTFTDQRLGAFPNVPTVVEALGDASAVRYGWLGIVARAGTPPAVVSAVESWTRDCVDAADFRAALAESLVTPRFVPQAEFSSWVRRDIEFWKNWISRLKIATAD